LQKNVNRKRIASSFSGRGPCVPTSVEGQCFHLRRLDLQILFMLMSSSSRSGSYCACVQTSPSLSLVW